MAKEDLATNPFQPISFSPVDKKQLQDVAQTILQANFDRYQHFRDVENSKVSPDSWKPVKSYDQVQVYHERQTRPPHASFDVSPATEASLLQSLLCVGLTPGKLEDLVSGLVNQTAEVTNDIGRAATLSQLKEPTPTKPYRSVAVKWAELDVRLKSVGLVKTHDYVYAESIGIRRLKDGEHVGYHLMHSIDVSKVNELPGRVRAQLSVCSFFRQEDDSSVSIYALGIMDSLSDRTQRTIVPHFVKTLLSLFKQTQYNKMCSCTTESPGKHCVGQKKLEPEAPGGDTCNTSRKRLWKLGKLSSHQEVCNVCSGNVCSSCKIVRELNFVTSDFQMTQRNVIFCSSCASEADAYGSPKTENTKPGLTLRPKSKKFGI